jgi:hypothetical protein
MRTSILLVASMSVLVGDNITIGDDTRMHSPPPSAEITNSINKQGSENRLLIKMCICEGDPLGSRVANTIRSLTENTGPVLENTPLRLHHGGTVLDPVDSERIPYGFNLEAKWKQYKDGKLRLDFTAAIVSITGQIGERLRIHTESVRTLTEIELDEVIKIPLGDRAAAKQTWVEVSLKRN